MDQLGDMILNLNGMLRDEFYPIVGEEKSRRFEATWGSGTKEMEEKEKLQD